MIDPDWESHIRQRLELVSTEYGISRGEWDDLLPEGFTKDGEAFLPLLEFMRRHRLSIDYIIAGDPAGLRRQVIVRKSHQLLVSRYILTITFGAGPSARFAEAAHDLIAYLRRQSN